MLNKVKTYLITGSLGVGKTSLIQQLLQQKPANQQWAVLINEFGKIGVDQALLDEQAVTITEIAGGCVCCTSGAPFQVGLTKLLKEAKPQLLFIELSGLGHPIQVQRQLLTEPWLHTLGLQPIIQVVAANQLNNFTINKGTGLLVINKAEQVTTQQQQAIAKQFPNMAIYWTSQGYLPLARLPNQQAVATDSEQLLFKPKPTELHSTQLQQQLAEGITCSIQDQPEAWSIGWLLQPSFCFNKAKLATWLEQYNWLRAKLVVQTEQGWLSYNATNDQQSLWKTSEWRKDNRLELIFTNKQAQQPLIEGLLACLN